ncbi:YraN family protein [Dehalobacter sp. DCM]|uniref:YraN family protein n=1 Tax=Dehalobacter sp. DCM TaxID=2907827 RepID=UPI0030819DDC|nr:YraN family protein [Dehalobacter sp. DCM]
MNKKELGLIGEDLATKHLEQKGLTVVKRNYRCPKGEMDIIAREGKILIFVEVRLRTSTVRGYAEESIGLWKKQRLRSIATYFLLEQGYETWPEIRFDIVAINVIEGKPTINWLQGAL